MRITKLELYTDTLDLQKAFYTKSLGFDISDSSADHFTVNVGWSTLTFKKSKSEHRYHYCFLVPCNRLDQAKTWMSDRTQLIEIEPGRYTQSFDEWNAESFYFYDGSGNLAECIVRHDLENESQLPFDKTALLCVNEIGLPTSDIKKTNQLINQLVGSQFWKGDTARFGAHGDDEGLILLPNYDIKKTWFPTDLKTTTSPFVATLEYLERKTIMDVSEDRWKS